MFSRTRKQSTESKKNSVTIRDLTGNDINNITDTEPLLTSSFVPVTDKQTPSKRNEQKKQKSSKKVVDEMPSYDTKWTSSIQDNESKDDSHISITEKKDIIKKAIYASLGDHFAGKVSELDIDSEIEQTLNNVQTKKIKVKSFAQLEEIIRNDLIDMST